jgi:hypothetical protein
VPSAVRGALVPGLVLGSCLVLLAGCGGGPIEITPPSSADRAACDRLAAALPDRIADLTAVDVTPTDSDGAAWGDPAITLTCGVPAPAGFGPASTCITADGVDWFASDKETNDNDSDITLTAVTLRPRVAVHVPAKYRGGTSAAALTDLAGPLERSLTAGTRCQ